MSTLSTSLFRGQTGSPTGDSHRAHKSNTLMRTMNRLSTLIANMAQNEEKTAEVTDKNNKLPEASEKIHEANESLEARKPYATVDNMKFETDIDEETSVAWSSCESPASGDAILITQGRSSIRRHSSAMSGDKVEVEEVEVVRYSSLYSQQSLQQQTSLSKQNVLSLAQYDFSVPATSTDNAPLSLGLGYSHIRSLRQQTSQPNQNSLSTTHNNFSIPAATMDKVLFSSMIIEEIETSSSHTEHSPLQSDPKGPFTLTLKKSSTSRVRPAGQHPVLFVGDQAVLAQPMDSNATHRMAALAIGNQLDLSAIEDSLSLEYSHSLSQSPTRSYRSSMDVLAEHEKAIQVLEQDLQSNARRQREALLSKLARRQSFSTKQSIDSSGDVTESDESELQRYRPPFYTQQQQQHPQQQQQQQQYSGSGPSVQTSTSPLPLLEVERLEKLKNEHGESIQNLQSALKAEERASRERLHRRRTEKSNESIESDAASPSYSYPRMLLVSPTDADLDVVLPVTNASSVVPSRLKIERRPITVATTSDVTDPRDKNGHDTVRNPVGIVGKTSVSAWALQDNNEVSPAMWTETGSSTIKQMTLESEPYILNSTPFKTYNVLIGDSHVADASSSSGSGNGSGNCSGSGSGCVIDRSSHPRSPAGHYSAQPQPNGTSDTHKNRKTNSR